MGNALKDFVSARRAGKASLVAKKVSIILGMATSCFTFILFKIYNTHCSIIETASKVKHKK